MKRLVSATLDALDASSLLRRWGLGMLDPHARV